jgi:hypothetical protein
MFNNHTRKEKNQPVSIVDIFNNGVVDNNHYHFLLLDVMWWGLIPFVLVM